jgi:hypothetical protein
MNETIYEKYEIYLKELEVPFDERERKMIWQRRLPIICIFLSFLQLPDARDHYSWNMNQ